jgi:hypothetical protein
MMVRLHPGGAAAATVRLHSWHGPSLRGVDRGPATAWRRTPTPGHHEAEHVARGVGGRCRRCVPRYITAIRSASARPRRARSRRSRRCPRRAPRRCACAGTRSRRRRRRGWAGRRRAARSRRQLAREDDLLLVAARQAATGRATDWVRMSNSSMRASALRTRRAQVERAPSLNGRAVGWLSTRFSAMENSRRSRRGWRSSGTKPMPASMVSAGRRVGDVDAVERDAPGERRSWAEQGVGELGLAVALDAGDARDLAAAHLEVDVVDERRRPRGWRP